MHHTCNLKYGWHEGMERIPHKLRGRLTEMIWWLPEAMDGILVHGGPWPKKGPTGFMAKIVSMGFLANFGSKELVTRSGSGGPKCGLGPTWMPPFGLIGLGQKGPNWPTDRMDRRSHRGSKWPKKAI
ncbi:hypothetical protein O181_112136 [Austropuccinia psidii MF-1]|uniref:Uncharacterized protein n=1 Tax=Austropuccinia psidii MF-1 TaxID=1389203 RepID=A0A9Q3PTA6_9BASI|nr:hypothetical protein [Austropuccinia psidii MF-1]